MKKLLLGRSILEVLLVLAIVGILSIAAVLGLRIAFTNAQANKIFSDAHMAYISVHSVKRAPEDWEPVKEFSPESGLLTEVYRDLENHDFVRVLDIKKAVCEKILTMTVPGLTLYHNDGQPLESCDQEIEPIIFSFEGFTPIIECDTWQDCAHLAGSTDDNYPRLCMDNICSSCPLGYLPDSLHEECESICKDIGTLCINDQLKQAWCCNSETELCGQQMGPSQCITSDDQCTYNFYTSDSPGLTYYTDCSCDMFETSHNVSYYTDCYCDADTNGNVSCSQCPSSNYYCAVNWTKSAWEGHQTTPSVTASSTGRLYGKCMILSVFDSTPLSKGSGASVICSDCPKDNFYCAINWTQNTWSSQETEPVATSTSTGKLYGKCVPLAVYDTVPMSKHASGDNPHYAAIKKCPEAKYCLLKYTNEECDPVTSTTTGQIYGVCTMLNTSSNDVCPYAQ